MMEIIILLAALTVSFSAPFIVNLKAYRRWRGGFWIRVYTDWRWQSVDQHKYRTMLANAYYPCQYEEYKR